MQVIMPVQQDNWTKVKDISHNWVLEDPEHADAWYFLGLAEFKLKNYAKAINDFKKAITLNERHLDSLVELYNIAKIQNDEESLEWATEKMRVIDADFVEYDLKNAI